MVNEDAWWAPIAFFWAVIAILVIAISYNLILALALCGIVAWMWRQWRQEQNKSKTF